MTETDFKSLRRALQSYNMGLDIAFSDQKNSSYAMNMKSLMTLTSCQPSSGIYTKTSVLIIKVSLLVWCLDFKGLALNVCTLIQNLNGTIGQVSWCTPTDTGPQYKLIITLRDVTHLVR